MKAVLSNGHGLGAGWWRRVRGIGLERRLALLLAIAATAAGLATYWVIWRAPPYGGDIGTILVLLNLDLVLLLLLGLVIVRRLVQLVLQLRRGSAGSRLHTRLVALFSGLAVTPAVIVVVFSVSFLNAGLENWFSERVRTALANSLSVAQAYLEEHKEVIRADALAMAADLNRESASLSFNPGRLRQVVNAQAALRSLTEAIVFDGAGRVLARTGLSFTLEIERLPEEVLQRAFAGEVVTLTSDTDDRVRALVRLDGFGEAYLFVGRFVDAKVLGFMERTQAIAAEYERMRSERSGIQITSALIFIIVALLLLFASMWVGLNLANQLVAPISRLITAANRVRSGDLLARVPEDGPDSDELVMLSRAFNRMTNQLENQRRELIEANRQLDERRRFTETVLAGVSAGVVGLDLDHRIVLPNRAAQDFLGGDGEIVGHRIETLLPGAGRLFEALAQRPGEVVKQELALIRGGRERMLLVRLSPQRDGERTLGYVVTFDDITALIAAQRQAAWSEVARRIAHEVKNPLTPIRLSAERLQRKYLAQIDEGQEAFKKSIATIVRQVDTIGHLIGEFSAFARMPAPVMREECLDELVKDAVFLQQAAHPGIRFAVELPPGGPARLLCDGPKVSQALTNLLQNSINAVSEEGRPDGGAVTVRVRPGEAVIEVEVEDDGPGFPADAERLFEPYVTTRAKGTGLGLAIVRKIMEEHGGSVELLAGTGRGALVRLTFPRRTDAARLEGGPRRTDAARPEGESN